MDFTGYILDGYLIVAPVLLIIGVFIKSIPNIPDWTIPFVLLVIGVAACIGISFTELSNANIVEAILQGVLVTGLAVLTNQGYKQITKAKNTTDGE